MKQAVGAPIISALIAASEMQPAGGGEFLAAVVLGYEVAARLAMAVGPEAHYRRGFHPTGSCGTFVGSGGPGHGAGAWHCWQPGGGVHGISGHGRLDKTLPPRLGGP